jgi:hypothetical protein
LIFIARDDDTTFGILQSRFHAARSPAARRKRRSLDILKRAEEMVTRDDGFLRSLKLPTWNEADVDASLPFIGQVPQNVWCTT